MRVAITSNIALIGARRSGKSKFSRQLSKRTGRLALSTDSLICYEAGGKSAEEIVTEEGWSGFREREFQILKKLSAMSNIIIDCGGGILVESTMENSSGEIFSERKSELLHASSHIILLKRDLSRLLASKPEDPNRPDLGGDYGNILRRRMLWYEREADYVLDMENLHLDEAINLIRERYF